jgi:undecaprenyl-diphosphatase
MLNRHTEECSVQGGAGEMRRFSRADRRIYMMLHARARYGRLDPLMIAITTSGTKGTVWIALALLLFAVGNNHLRYFAVLSVISLLIAEGSINLLLKPAIRRERPYVRNRLSALLVDAPGPHSWPSAHAGSSVASALLLTVGAWPWGILFLVLALLVGYSRVYVGVHYPLDVLAGYAVGCLAASLVLAAAAVIPLHL